MAGCTRLELATSDVTERSYLEFLARLRFPFAVFRTYSGIIPILLRTYSENVQVLGVVRSYVHELALLSLRQGNISTDEEDHTTCSKGRAHENTQTPTSFRLAQRHRHNGDVHIRHRLLHPRVFSFPIYGK